MMLRRIHTSTHNKHTRRIGENANTHIDYHAVHIQMIALTLLLLLLLASLHFLVLLFFCFHSKRIFLSHHHQRVVNVSKSI